MARILELAQKIIDALVAEGATNLEAGHAMACVHEQLRFRLELAEYEKGSDAKQPEPSEVK